MRRSGATSSTRQGGFVLLSGMAINQHPNVHPKKANLSICMNYVVRHAHGHAHQQYGYNLGLT